MVFDLKKQKVFMHLCISIIIFLLLMTSYSFAENKSDFVQKIPTLSCFFYAPHEVAVDGEGNIYVADTGNDRIQKFDASGAHVKTFGEEGSGAGQFKSPRGVAVDGHGNIYVADTGNDRIQKFDANGIHVKTIGEEGSGKGQFDNPNGVTVDGDGNIYVVDTGNHRIQKFDANGTHMKTIGEEGSGAGQFNSPYGVAIDKDGNIYVADKSNHRIQKFDVNGTHVKSFGEEGSGEGQFDNPKGVAIDKDGNIYVADTDNHRIQKFNSNGEYIKAIGEYGTGNGQFNDPRAITIDRDGNIYVTDTLNKRIQKFNSEDAHVLTLGSQGGGEGQFNYPIEVEVDGEGNIYVADTNNHRIQKLDASGVHVKTFGEEGSGEGQFDNPNGVTVDGDGNIYVADTDNHRIQKLDASGAHVKTFGEQGSGEVQFKSPSGVAVDGDGNIYVADKNNHRIQKFDANGEHIKTLGSQGFREGQFYYPEGVAVDGAGNIYVADTNNHRIQKFNADGTHVKTIGEGQFKRPSGVAVDGNGNIYVADTSNGRIQKFNAAGVHVKTFGEEGKGEGQFNYPQGIAVDHEDNVYVADTGNHRIQFMAVTALSITEIKPTDNQTDVSMNENISIKFNENIYGTDKVNTISMKKGEAEVEYGYEIHGNILTIDPNEDLDYSSTYTVTVPKGAIVDALNTSLENDYSFSFTTQKAPDTAAPFVISTEPGDNERDIFVNKEIKIDFSEKILPKDLKLLTVEGDTVVDYAYDLSEERLTITPKDDLDYETLYTVSIPAGTVQDVVYNPSNSYVFNFTTQDEPDFSAPYVTSTEPDNNEGNIPVDQEIKIDFSENILLKDIKLLTVEGDTVVDYVYEISEERLTITPKDDLDYETLYTVSIPDGTVQDAVYNPSNSYAFCFTTIHNNTVPASNNADLIHIELSSGSLSPDFASDITEYQVNVGYDVSSITLTPTLKDAKAKIKVNGALIDNNTVSNPISLKVGDNNISILVTAEDEKTTKVYGITVTRADDDHKDSGGNNHGSDSDKKQDSTTPSDKAKENDEILKKSLEKTGQAVLSLKNMKDAEAKITLGMIQELNKEDKSLTVENKGIKLDFMPNFLKTNADDSEETYLELGAKALTVIQEKKVLKKALAGESTGIFEVGGKIFDLTAQVETKNADGRTKTEKIDSFTEPVAITIDLSDLRLTDEDIANLTGIRYEKDADGEITPVKLGGVYDQENKRFTFYTDQFSLYSVVKAQDLMEIDFVIGEQEVLVNKVLKENDSVPRIMNNRTMVPLRFIAENMGAIVDWNGEKREVTIALDGQKMSMIIDKNIEEMDTPPTIVEGRTLVPVRYISEKFGATVMWFPTERKVHIVK